MAAASSKHSSFNPENEKLSKARAVMGLEAGATTIASDDDTLLASLGYRAELKREFSYFTVFGQSFGAMGIAPAIAESIIFSLGSAGAVGMVWTYLMGCLLLIPVALSLGELGSSMPTAGGLYYVRHGEMLRIWQLLTDWTVGCTIDSRAISSIYVLACVCTPDSLWKTVSNNVSSGYMNVLGYISIYASTIYAATLILGATINIGTEGAFVASKYHNYGMFAATTFLTFGMTCVPSKTMSRLNFSYIFVQFAMLLALIISLAAATPKELKNSASFVFVDLQNTGYWTNKYGSHLLSKISSIANTKPAVGHLCSHS